MYHNKLLDFFPFDSKIQNIRDNQKLALNKIWDSIQKGDKKCILSAPVGSGKSKIAETVMRYFKSLGLTSCYTSPLNSLVDQIEDTKNVKSGIVTLKGRGHYNCNARGGDWTCDEGYCVRKVCWKTKGLQEKDRVKRECKGCQISYCICNDCEYKKVFKSYKSSTLGNTNSSLWLMKIVPDSTSILIIDEIDSLEEFVRLQNQVSVPYILKSNNFSEHIEEAVKYANLLSSCVNCTQNMSCIPKKVKPIENKINSIYNMENDYEVNKEKYVIKREIKGDSLRMIYEPVTVNRFIEPLLEDLTFVLAMSATPPKWKEWNFIEVPSSFPIDIRRCYYHPLGKMSTTKINLDDEKSLSYREQNIPKVADFLTTLKGKSVVHCISYSNADSLAFELRKLGNYPLLQINGNQNNIEPGVPRWDAVRAFKASQKPNEILLSVNLDTGVDYWEPEIQNNIIPFMPFQNHTDPLVQAKTNLMGEFWKDEATAITIEQANGRIHRGIFYYKDVIKQRPDLFWLPRNERGMIIKQTIITDSNFNSGSGKYIAWYERNKRYFSNSFNEAMVLNKRIKI